MGRLLQFSGWLIWLSPLISFLLLACFRLDLFKATTVILFLLWVLLLPVGAFIFITGAKLRTRSAQAVMLKDARAPVLLLWPFRGHGDERPRAEGDMGMAVLTAIAPFLALVTFLVDAYLCCLSNVLGTTAEQQLVKSLNKIGPTIAIGRPGIAFSPLGATRFCASDDDWKRVTQEMSASSRPIVVKMGLASRMSFPQDVNWQISLAVMMNREIPVLAFFPDNDPHREHKYLAFLDKMPVKIRNRLSGRLEDALFVYLPTSGEPMLLTPGPSGAIRTALQPAFDSLPAAEPRWILADLVE